MRPISPTVHAPHDETRPTGSFASVAITRDEIRVLLIFNDYVPGGDRQSLHSIPRLRTSGSIMDPRSRLITLPVDDDILDDSNIVNIDHEGTLCLTTYLPSSEDMTSLRRITMTGSYEGEEYGMVPNPDNLPAPVILRAPSVRFRDTSGYNVLDEYMSDMSGHEILAQFMNKRTRILSGETDDEVREATATIIRSENYHGFLPFRFRLTYQQDIRRYDDNIYYRLRDIDDLDRRAIYILRKKHSDHSGSLVKTNNIFYFSTIEIRDIGRHGHEEQDLIRQSFGYDLKYPLTFYLRHKDMIRGVRQEETRWQTNAWMAWQEGARGNYRIKLNARVKGMQPIHDMVRWYSRSVHINGSSRHTIVMHPLLLEYLRLYEYDVRTVIEGMILGNGDRYNAVRSMGQCNNELGSIANIPAATCRYKFIGSMDHYYSVSISKPHIRDTIISFICQKASDDKQSRYLRIWKISKEELLRYQHEKRDVLFRHIKYHWQQDDRGVTNNNASNAAMDE